MRPLRILLAEDEVLIVKDIENKLNRMGYEFAGYVTSGKDAIQFALENQPGLILMDVCLRGEIDGIEAAKQIRSNLDIPIIFITAYAEAETLQRAKTTEPYGYILKPVAARELSIAVEIATYKHKAEKERQQQLRQRAAMRAIDQAILNHQNTNEMLNIAIEQIAINLNVDAVTILLLNPHSHMLSYVAQYGLDAAMLNLNPQPLGVGYAGQAALNGQRIFISDLKNYHSQRRFSSYAAIPMICKGQVRGVLEICHSKALHLEEDWLDFLETLANQTAIAIDNAGMMQELIATNLNLLQAYDTTIAGWSKALELRNLETAGHSQRVTEMTIKLARALNIEKNELEHIRRGALLHDVGKMGIPDHILLKPGKLNAEEWKIMRKHPVYAYEMLSEIPFLKPALEIPYAHHEKWDGSGYPLGLKGKDIPLAARIFAIVDVFDALSYDRVYQKAWPFNKIIPYIQDQSGKHFDPQVVESFLKLIESDSDLGMKDTL